MFVVGCTAGHRRWTLETCSTRGSPFDLRHVPLELHLLGELEVHVGTRAPESRVGCLGQGQQSELEHLAVDNCGQAPRDQNGTVSLRHLG